MPALSALLPTVRVKRVATQSGLHVWLQQVCKNGLQLPNVHLIKLLFHLEIVFPGGTAGVTTGGAAVPAAILACNVAQGACMATCAAIALAPTP